MIQNTLYLMSLQITFSQWTLFLTQIHLGHYRLVTNEKHLWKYISFSCLMWLDTRKSNDFICITSHQYVQHHRYTEIHITLHNGLECNKNRPEYIQSLILIYIYTVFQNVLVCHNDPVYELGTLTPRDAPTYKNWWSNGL